MSATNKTTYYELPVFIATDEPKWLTDWNGAMNIIDGAIAEAKTAADNAQTTANANALAISGLSDSVSTISTALSTLTTTVNTLNGTVNTITELIGNGTPTTSDKTIIGAINELKAAIDALAPGGAVQADEVEYNNTESGLTATNVQDAIDELAQASAGYDLNLVNNVTATITPIAGLSASGAGEINVLTNADASIGKIYGGVYLSGSLTTGTGWTDVCTIAASNLPTIAESYNIMIGFTAGTVSGDFAVALTRLVFNTNGTVTVQINPGGAITFAAIAVSLAPCLLFLKDLGD